MSVNENLQKVLDTLPSHVKLVAVSKTKPEAMIMEAYQFGQRLFGENKVQELMAKQLALPADIEWHFIGHLQSNKVKYIAPFVAMIHAVDSLKLLKTIDREGAKNHRVINCLLQFYIADEETKFGLNMEEAIALLESADYASMKHVRLCGVMGMATFTSNSEQLSHEFKTLNNIFQELKNRYFHEDQFFSEISMGMSDDYLIALAQGSTMVRIGSTIFGERKYNHST
ncbi:MAG: YggS family pyridoxal phosphate-dependent enzyme [Prolixibacteraceae bacterium]|nr:YggS family pyridoxal phosphate-dependent enzyme [Prolixibacteraceae bacterium]